MFLANIWKTVFNLVQRWESNVGTSKFLRYPDWHIQPMTNGHPMLGNDVVTTLNYYAFILVF